MGSEIPDGFGQATLEMDFVTGPSNPMACVIGYENASAQSPLTNAGIIRDEFVSNVLADTNTSNNVALLRVNVIQNPGGQTASSASNAVGANSDSTCPPQVAYLIRKSSATGGRTGRGRLYMPGVLFASITEGGSVQSGAITSLSDSFNEWNANLTSNSIPMVILHALGSVLPPVEVTGLQCDAIVATQRRRLRG